MDPNIPAQENAPQMPRQPVETPPSQPLAPTPVSQPIEPQPAQAFIPTEPKKPSLLPKILMFFVLIIIVMIVSSGGTYLALKNKKTTPAPITSQAPTPTIEITSSPTPSPDPTANWRTYTNTKYNYSVKYPNNFVFETKFQPEKSDSIALNDRTDQKSSAKFISIVIGYTWGLDMRGTKQKCATDDECFQKEYSELTKFPRKDIATISGNLLDKEIKGIQYSNKNQFYKVFPFSLNGEFFSIGFTFVNYSNDEIKAKEDIVVNILSTFKLIEPSPTSSTAQISAAEKKLIDSWILKNNLNEFGDLKETMYAGGTPLFDEKTGKTIDKYDYILQKHPDRPWNR